MRSAKSMCHRAARILASWIWRASKRTASIFTRRTGGRTSRWRTFCPLELAGSRRAGHAGVRLHLRRFGGTFPQRQIARAKKKGRIRICLRWNDVVYQPGELKVVAYKNGKNGPPIGETTGAPAKLPLSADHTEIGADGTDLSFITVDRRGQGRIASAARKKSHPIPN